MQSDPTGAKAPTGGFKDLGWYGGYQYYKGSFAPQAGVIHPSSPQQGAGSPVSSEVNRQGDVARGEAPGTADTYLQQLAKTDRNPVQEQDYQRLLAESGGGAAGTSGMAGSGSGAGIGIAPAATLDLPKLYEGLFAGSGIKELEGELSAKEKAFNDAQLKINDNPFLSEASRVGRVQKLQTDYNNNIASLKNDVATKKADIEMKLNLETKQFDINSQQAQQSLSQFNSLLESGALANASGEDIANITRATGISSNMINSAIKYQKDKNTPTEVIQIDDGTNIKAVVMNSKTGQVISSSILSASKPAAQKAAPAAKETDYVDMLKADARSGLTLAQIYSIYSGYLQPDKILQLYNSSSRYGAAKETPAQLAKYGVTQPKATTKSTGRST